MFNFILEKVSRKIRALYRKYYRNRYMKKCLSFIMEINDKKMREPSDSLIDYKYYL